MAIKEGVKLGNLQPQMVLAYAIVKPILERYSQKVMVTSGAEGEHSKNSKHFIGQALDFRTWILQEQETEETCAKVIQKALGSEYYVKLHPGSHIHVQYNGSITY